jgi:hypothetical protein
MLKCTSAVCVLTYGEGCKSDVRNASVRINLGDEVRVRALTGPEAVPGVRDLAVFASLKMKTVDLYRRGHSGVYSVVWRFRIHSRVGAKM